MEYSEVKCTYSGCDKAFSSYNVFFEHVQKEHVILTDGAGRYLEDNVNLNNYGMAETNSYGGMEVDESIWSEVILACGAQENDFEKEDRTLQEEEQKQVLEDMAEIIREDNQRAIPPMEMQSNALGLQIQKISKSQLCPPLPSNVLLETSASSLFEVIENPTGCFIQWANGVESDGPEQSVTEVSNDQVDQLTADELGQALFPRSYPLALQRNYRPLLGGSVNVKVEPTEILPYWEDARVILRDAVPVVKKQKGPKYQLINWRSMFNDPPRTYDQNSDTMSAVDESEEVIEPEVVNEREIAVEALPKLSHYEVKEPCEEPTLERQQQHLGVKTFGDLIPHVFKNREIKEMSPSKWTLKNLLYPPARTKPKKAKKIKKLKSSPIKPVAPVLPVREKVDIYYSYDFLIKEGLKRTGTPDKPYACPVPDCEKTYKNANGMKYHARYGHSPRQEFPCLYDGCKKIYTTKHGLNAHRKIHPDWKASVKDERARGVLAVDTPLSVLPLKLHLSKIKVEQCASDSESENQRSPTQSRSATCFSAPECNQTNSQLPEVSDKKQLAEHGRINTNPLRIKLEINEPIDESLLSDEVLQPESDEDEPVPPSPSFLQTEFVFRSPKKQFAVGQGVFADVRRRLNFSNNWSVGKDSNVGTKNSGENKAQSSLYFFPQVKGCDPPKTSKAEKYNVQRHS